MKDLSKPAITIDDNLSTISAYWSGPKMGWMQLACLTSFAMHGHRVIVYTDNDNLEVPEFIDVQPADKILKHSPRDKAIMPPVLKSDMFRLKLFESTHTIWADTDAYCTAPFNFVRPHVFGKLDGGLATGVLRLPQDSPVLRDMLDFALEGKDFPHWISPGRQKRAEAFNHLPPMDRLLQFFNIRMGVLGPNALNHYARKHRVGKQSLPGIVFYPLSPGDCYSLFQAGSMNVLDNPRTVSVHFYGRKVGALVDNVKSNHYPVGSFAHHAYKETEIHWQHLL